MKQSPSRGELAWALITTFAASQHSIRHTPGALSQKLIITPSLFAFFRNGATRSSSANSGGRVSALFALLPITFVLAAILGAAQQNCPIPPAILPVPKDIDIFSDQQEIDLGDAMAESLGQHVKVIYDDALNSYLRTLGDRLVQHLPPTQLKFRFYLMDLPEVNAYSISGGRVYVSRKMVALAKTDDELAGVLAHELGHIVTHQSAIEMTKNLREVLGVNQVGDRSDIFEKYHLLLENAARKKEHGGHDEEKHQFVADQVALYAMARAGYAPHAYVDLWDRFQQTHGKTGSWFSNFFGSTKPSEQRLREMLKNVSALPAGCAEIPPGSRTLEFAKWQAEVVNYSGIGTQELLPGLISKQTLARPLRPDISNLRFSADGNYLLAQDEGGIHVLKRDPLSVLFYIPALAAHDAVFTPDSRSIVFHLPSLRVESWSVADQRRNWVHEITVLHPCIQSALSPDGSVLACLNLQFDLSLIDVSSESEMVTKKSFLSSSFFQTCVALTTLAEGGETKLVQMAFSPDGRYFLAGVSGSQFAWDLRDRRELSLPSSIKDVMKTSITFLGPDRVVGVNTSSPAKSPILRFPSGERLQEVHLATGIGIRAATHGEFLLVGPLRKFPLGLFDIKNGTLPIDFKKNAADIYDTTFVTEQKTGEIALNALGKTDTLATVKLPQARLGPLRAAAVTPDFGWLLLSNQTRGAAWDLAHNIQTLEVRSFGGAWFAPDQFAYIDFPKFDEMDRQIMQLDLTYGNAKPGYKIGDEVAKQYGPYILVTKKRRKQITGEILFTRERLCLEMLLGGAFRETGSGLSDVDVELRDIRDGHIIWSRYFPHEMPSLSFGQGRVVLTWPLADAAARDELTNFSALKDGADKSDYLLEQVSLQPNTPASAFLIKTNKGSFTIKHTFQMGSWVIASASGNQVFTYALETGQVKAHLFGTSPSASSNGLLAIETEVGQMKLYDIATSQLKQQYMFSDPVSFKVFSPDGSRLFVMTASQTAYILDVTKSSRSDM